MLTKKKNVDENERLIIKLTICDRVRRRIDVEIDVKTNNKVINFVDYC